MPLSFSRTRAMSRQNVGRQVHILLCRIALSGCKSICSKSSMLCEHGASTICCSMCDTRCNSLAFPKLMTSTENMSFSAWMAWIVMFIAHCEASIPPTKCARVPPCTGFFFFMLQHSACTRRANTIFFVRHSAGDTWTLLRVAHEYQCVAATQHSRGLHEGAEGGRCRH